MKISIVSYWMFTTKYDIKREKDAVHTHKTNGGV